MAKDTIVLLEKGTGKSAAIKDVEIPDLWHVQEWLRDQARRPDSPQTTLRAWADMVLETWHTAHALRNHIMEH